MQEPQIGQLQQQVEGYKAFIPYTFPPKEGFAFPAALVKKATLADRLIGKLDGITKLLPDADFFLLMYLRKDAASSSQIEGTQATMVDAIEAQVAQGGQAMSSDVDDILHYIRALDYGLKRVQKDKFPLSLRFVRELHEQLMQEARATHHSYPGEFRRGQNWISGSSPSNARFVPPPVPEMQRSLGDLESFIHAEDDIPEIIKAALIHAQFETIHPFTDGNGRTGRMLITFYFWQQGCLEKPVLFLSSYFKKHQDLYYEKLRGYHSGAVYAWVEFFLEGVIEIAQEAIVIAEKITKLRERDMVKIQQLGKRSAESAMTVLPKLYEQPIVTVELATKWTRFTWAGAQRLIERFIGMGILVPIDAGKKYGQSYIYREYVEIFADR